MKRVIGIIVGLLIAAIGTGILMGYVDHAKRQALAEESLATVYVVRSVVPKGTPSSDVSGSVDATQVPTRLVAPGAVTDLESLDPALVTATDLLVGEQIVTARFTDPRAAARTDVPAGLQELTIALDAERALGGSLLVGDTVGIVASFEPKIDPGATGTDDAGQPTPALAPPTVTATVLHRILVTGVQFSTTDVDAVKANTEAGTQGPTGAESDAVVVRAPASQVLVTLAVDAASAAKLVYAAEFGNIWLTLEGPDADTTSSGPIGLGDVIGAKP